jgi:hypothetical protein
MFGMFDEALEQFADGEISFDELIEVAKAQEAAFNARKPGMAAMHDDVDAGIGPVGQDLDDAVEDGNLTEAQARQIFAAIQ